MSPSEKVDMFPLDPECNYKSKVLVGTLLYFQTVRAQQRGGGEENKKQRGHRQLQDLAAYNMAANNSTTGSGFIVILQIELDKHG